VSQSQQQIIAAIQTCARQLGRVPTRVELKQITGISYPALRYSFGNMARAVREAGFEPVSTSQAISEEDLLLDWAQVARKLGKLPGVHAYLESGRYTQTPFFRHYRSWLALPGAFRDLVRQRRLEDEWQDVLEMIGPAAEAALAKTAARLPDTRNHAATRQPLPVKAPVSRSRPGGRPYRRACFPDRPVAGPPLEFDALAYAPVNELGVVFAFGMLARRLGFRVLSIQQEFPDCEAMYEVRPGIWQRVRIEFEYESRNFHRHRHHPDGCDIIVCWRHNWKECPPHLEVIELSKLVAQL
jgi:hypothetical protein